MDIKMLYEEYMKLKQQNMDFEDLEFSFYSILTNLKDEEKDLFDKWDLEDEIVPRPDYSINFNFGEYLANRRYFRYYEDSGFIAVSYLKASPIEKNYLKLYFSVPNSLKKEFMVKYGIFVKENQIRGTYKIRKNKQANDLVTVRVYNPKHFSKVFEFIKNFSNKEIEQHLFMPTVDGIGVTIDDGESYNRYVTNVLMNYFNKCCVKEDVSICNFLKYVALNEVENSKSSIIYNYNLLNSIENNLKIDDIFSVIKNIQQSIEEHNVNDNEIYSILNENKVLKMVKIENKS